MSFNEYSKWWAATKRELDILIADEKKYEKLLTKFKTDRNVVSYLLSGIYAKYSILVQKIGLIYDQMVQPQKREIVRKLLDVAEIRLIELNNQLRSVDISEFHYLDRNLIEFKLIPQEIEILDTFFYYLRHHKLEELWARIKKGEKIYVPPPPTPPPSPPAEPLEVEQKKVEPKRRPAEIEQILTPEQEQQKRIASFVILLQRNERGRQDRLYYGDKRRISRIKQQYFSDPDREQAATTIQALWRGHTVRQMMQRRDKQRRLVIGMTIPSYQPRYEFKQLQITYKKRQELRNERIKEFIETNLSERERIFRVRGPGLMEDIGDEIREWFRLFYDTTKSFQPIPPVEEGGTILVVRGETLTPEEWMAEQQKKEKSKKKKKPAKPKKPDNKEKEKKKKELEKQKKELKRKKQLLKKGQFELDLEPTGIGEIYPDAHKEYQYMWTEKKDEDNPEENIYLDLIQEEKYHEMQLELRPIVDEMMRIELELLLKALAKDNRKKYKKKKNKKKRKRKKKKGKKDPFDKRSIEDLFQELVDIGIIHTYDETVTLRDFKGDFSYKNWDLRQVDLDPPTTLGDLRQVIKINCILPLNVTTLKKPRSILIAGYKQSGKHLLAQAIFAETRCILFDLSPEILAGKYRKKKELKLLSQMVVKVSKILQPSIIFIDNVERVFYKRVPAIERALEPKKLSKVLFKELIKPLKPEDRVLVLGVTGRPWLAKVRKLIKTFERIIPIPRPDYNTVVLYLTELLMSYHGVDRNFNVSSLAKLITNYTLPTIREAIENVLVQKRIISLSYQPLVHQELFEEFLKLPTINEKEYRKFVKFYEKTPLGKDRKVVNKFFDKKRGDEKKMQQRR